MLDKTKILTQTDLRALAEEAGAKFNHSNRSACPLHQGNNPTAFHVYQTPEQVWRWRCFTGCPDGANGGNAIDFYMAWQGVDYPTALTALSERLGLQPSHPPLSLQPSTFPPPKAPPPPAWQQRALQFITYAQAQLWTPAGQPALAYLQQKRGLTPATIRAWQLGYNPRDIYDLPERWGRPAGGKKIWCARGIVYPNMRSGQVWSINVRRPLPGDDLAAAIGPVSQLPKEKYIEPRGGRRGLFGLDHLSQKTILILTEGEPDCILAWQAISPLADVLTLGGARHQPDLLEAALLTRYPTILAIYDADGPGQQGLAFLQSISRRIVPVQLPSPGSPPSQGGVAKGYDLTDYYNTGGNLVQWLTNLITPYASLPEGIQAGPEPSPATNSERVEGRLTPLTMPLDDLPIYLHHHRLRILPNSLHWEPDPTHPGRKRIAITVAPINEE